MSISLWVLQTVVLFTQVILLGEIKNIAHQSHLLPTSYIKLWASLDIGNIPNPCVADTDLYLDSLPIPWQVAWKPVWRNRVDRGWGGAVLKPASGDLGSYPETLSQGFPSLQNKGLN